MQEKLRRNCFYPVVLVNFIFVTVYEFLTPMMTDDIIYSDVVRDAGSFWGLFVQEYEHYMNHIGRSVAHILLRIFLYIGNKGVFNVAAGAVFAALSLLIYANVRSRKKYDVRVYLLILMMLWMFEPTISNSVLWMTGACNYLFTAGIIFTFITLFKGAYDKGEKKSGFFAAGMFFLGILSGWCNENSSGGVIFMILLLMCLKWLKTRDFSGIRLWMITGLLGNIIGFVIMLASPGNFSRAEGAEEAHTGLLAIMARFLKITLNIKENYLLLLLVLVVILIAICYRSGGGRKFVVASENIFIFAAMFLATDYALIAVPDSQLRTYYCASLFLMTAIAEGFGWILNRGFTEDIVQIIGTSLAVVLSIIFVFTYIDEGANLARIKREFDERDEYLSEMAESGETDVEAPMLRPLWESRYSMAYESDISEDPMNWINLSYAVHNGLDCVVGVDREGWTEY